MTIFDCGGVELAVDQAGDGPSLILVHGAWSDRGTWDPVFAQLAQHFHTIRYDRRGYGESPRPGVDPRSQVADLLALIRTLALDEVMLVGNSLGGLISIHAALRATAAIRLVIAHEPPILRLLTASSTNYPVAARALRALYAALDAARDGQFAQAAQLYVEGMASYPGAWAYLPEIVRQSFTENASAFLMDSGALDDLDVTTEDFTTLGDRLVVTRGDRTSPFMKLLLDQLYREEPQLRRAVFGTGGHVPHQSSPAEFVTTTVELVRTALAASVTPRAT